jgi:NADPH2 dehydrogenase
MLTSQFPNLGYIHLVEGRDWTGAGDSGGLADGVAKSNDAFRSIIRGLGTQAEPSIYGTSGHSFPDPTPEHPTLVLSAAGHNEENVEEFVERTGDVAAIGRYFIANPDLPKRVFEGKKWAPYNRKTFYYGPGVEYERHVGYTDYPTVEQEASA